MAVLRAVRMAVGSTGWLVIGALLTQVLAALGAPAQLAVVRALIDRVASGNGRVTFLVALLVAVVVAQRLTALAMSSLLTLDREHAAAEAVSRFMAKAATLDAGRLHNPAFLDRMRHAGEVADQRFGLVVTGAVEFTGAVVGLAALSALLASVSPSVAALVALSILPWMFAEQRGFRLVREARLSLIGGRRRQAYLRSLVAEGDAAFELMASGAGATVAERHRVLSAELLRADRPAHVRQFTTIASGDMASALLLAAAFVVAVNRRATAGEVAAVVAGLTTFLATASRLANGVSKLLDHKPYLDDRFAFLGTPPLLTVPAAPARLPARLPAGLVFEEVTFRYPNAARPALDRVSFEVKQGELLAIVGPNGAGKTTLVKLLLRFYDPDEGGSPWPAWTSGSVTRPRSAPASAWCSRTTPATSSRWRGRCAWAGRAPPATPRRRSPLRGSPSPSTSRWAGCPRRA